MNMNTAGEEPHVVVVGGGFCGLVAAYEVTKLGLRVTVLEEESDIGGLAGSFLINGAKLEKFYHFWYTSDHYITSLARELGVDNQIVLRPTHTGIYYANKFFKLSSPLDVLRFSALKPIDRLRLGMLTLRARAVSDWKRLEDVSAAEWLRQIGGETVYKVVWEPLLRGKFGIYADDISAVWFWNKVKLRGGSRSKGGTEQVAYYRGGFAALADKLAAGIRARGGEIRTSARASGLLTAANRVAGVIVDGVNIPANAVIATTPLPVVADLLATHVSSEYVLSLRRIKYLANICLVLELDRSLSSTFWLNVNDPTFPFVGVIEHTNSEPTSTYGGRHIVYLSKYLPDTEPYFGMNNSEFLEYTLPHLRRMFPQFSRDWILGAHIWRARYSQPIVERQYSRMIPAYSTPLPGMYVA
jgi:protoporphyrinogen oxidase